MASTLLAGALISVLAYQNSKERKLGGEASPLTTAYVSTYEIVREFEHDPSKFTQGLAFHDDGTLYESTGLYHKSVVRAIGLKPDGSTYTKTETALPPAHFGEGLAVAGNTLMQLTWKEKTLHEYNVGSDGHIKLTRSVPLAAGREGWGLAPEGDKLYLTDSTADLFTLRRSDYAVLDRKQVVDPRLKGADGKQGSFLIHGVNELEMVEGELWGNVYPMYQGTHSECIVRINATSGEVIGWIDMRGLLARQSSHVRNRPSSYVLNGIAYHAASGRLYVTGKEWNKMYQVRIQPSDFGPDHVKKSCGLGNIAGQRSHLG